MEERLDSETVLDVVDKHKESVEGYVRRHDLDIYQINKLIKAETSMKDRNSVLNVLRKEREKIMQKQPRDQALKEDLRENRIDRETGQNTLNDLKNDIIDIRQEMTEINSASQEGDEDGEEESEEQDELLQDQEGPGGALPEGMKSRQKLEEEVENHFDSIPGDEEYEGIVSSFRNLISGDEEVSDITDLEPVDIFGEIRDAGDREKAVKAAYSVKKCLELERGERMSYGELSSLVRNGELEVESEAVADLFNYMKDYDYGPEFEFHSLEEAVSGCRALVQRHS